MVKYICFCQMTPEFLRLPLEKRKERIPIWRELACKHGLKMLFWGATLGVREHVVFVYESDVNGDNYIKFQREWQGLGTPEAGKFIEFTRSITVL